MPQPRKRANGEGSVEKLPSGKYRAVIRKDGTKHSKTFATHAEAREWLRAMSAANIGQHAKRPLADWLDSWLDSLEGNLQPATVLWYRSRVNRRIRDHLGSIQLANLKPRDVQRWSNEMVEEGLSARERHGALKTLRAALKVAVEQGEIPTNPAKQGVRLPKLKARTYQTWSREQVLEFLRASEGTEYEAFWWLAVDTGCRPSELFGLHWPEVDLTSGSVMIRQSLENLNGRPARLKEPKTPHSIRLLPITPQTIAKLEAHRQRESARGRNTVSGQVFCNTHGGWMRVNETRLALRAVTTLAGIDPIPVRDLRHTCATLLLLAGVPITIVSKRLGHSDIAITLKHYAAYLPQMQEIATAKMAEILQCPTTVPRSEKTGNKQKT